MIVKAAHVSFDIQCSVLLVLKYAMLSLLKLIGAAQIIVLELLQRLVSLLNFSSDLKENPAKWCFGPPFHMSPVSCTDYVGEKNPPAWPHSNRTARGENEPRA